MTGIYVSLAKLNIKAQFKELSGDGDKVRKKNYKKINEHRETQNILKDPKQSLGYNESINYESYPVITILVRK